ncbi:DNA polymerase alpha/epsilon subunit B-domain-containing protein [Gautieria morchelliformis]|nr:DNA polymerase alpha/epsilon subunit B-domain-containing protein [Gautieria morchelliformis]
MPRATAGLINRLISYAVKPRSSLHDHHLLVAQRTSDPPDASEGHPNIATASKPAGDSAANNIIAVSRQNPSQKALSGSNSVGKLGIHEDTVNPATTTLASDNFFVDISAAEAAEDTTATSRSSHRSNREHRYQPDYTYSSTGSVDSRNNSGSSSGSGDHSFEDKENQLSGHCYATEAKTLTSPPTTPRPQLRRRRHAAFVPSLTEERRSTPRPSCTPAQHRTKRNIHNSSRTQCRRGRSRAHVRPVRFGRDTHYVQGALPNMPKRDAEGVSADDTLNPDDSPIHLGSAWMVDHGRRLVTIVLEDESGKIGLVGERLTLQQHVTGTILAALGIETPEPRPPVANLVVDERCFAGPAGVPGDPDLLKSLARHRSAYSSLPGASDPSRTILPHQPLPRAMFGEVRRNERFKCETNTTWLMVDEQTILVTSGQTLDDVYKYLDSTDERLTVATYTLDWRHMAPTAPDTLVLPVSLHKILLSYLRRPTYTIWATSHRPQRH